MTTFSIEAFAADCKEAMAAAPDSREAARALLEATIAGCGADVIIAALQAAVPPGASVGEMIVHASPELTMLYARIPARFQSGIHNHTVCACIGQLEGEDINTFFEAAPGGGLREVQRTMVRAGEVLTLDADVIHCIENPGSEAAHALHLYAGDFGALMDQRSLWASEDHQERAFSFPALVRESAVAMHRSGNREGLDALGDAIPAAQAVIDSL